MKKELKLSELRNLSAKNFEAKLEDFFSDCFDSPNGTLDSLKAKIEERESFYGISSEEMLARINAGTLQETEDLACWSVDYALWQDLSRAAHPAKPYGV